MECVCVCACMWGGGGGGGRDTYLCTGSVKCAIMFGVSLHVLL